MGGVCPRLLGAGDRIHGFVTKFRNVLKRSVTAHHVPTMNDVSRDGDASTVPAVVLPRHRVDDLAAIEDFLTQARSGSRALVLEGDAGIGKTTLAEACIQLARGTGYSIAIARSVRPDFTLSFAALGDLYSLVPDRIMDTLPLPQREALDVALLRAPSRETPPDARAISLATLQTVRSVAAETPLLIVLEDVQWLDQSSAQVIAFVLQRLTDEPVAVLATRRVGDAYSRGIDIEQVMGTHRVSLRTIGPLNAESLAAICRDRLPDEIPRSVLLQVHELVDGNPFYGLEVARELLRRGVPAPGEPLPVPPDILAFVRRRIEELPDRTRGALLVVALTSAPTIDLVRSCQSEDPSAADDSIAEAERADLVLVRSGRVRFVHPLYASMVITSASAPEQRAVHRRIAEHVTDVEQRARHLALSTPAEDEGIAAALDEASAHARARGAAVTGAELAVLACQRTPAHDRASLARRTLIAGLLSFEAGDATRAHELLDRAIELAEPGLERAMVMVTRTEITWQDTVTVEGLARRALDEADDHPACSSMAHSTLAWVHYYRGELQRAREEAAAALAIISDHPDPTARADALTVKSIVDCLLGDPFDEALDEAERLVTGTGATTAADGGTIYSSASVIRGLLRAWQGDLAAARTDLEGELSRYDDRGRFIARDEILCYLGSIGCRDGAWIEAAERSEESLEIGAESGHLRGRGQNIVPRAWAAALRGDLDAARTDALEGLALSVQYRDEVSAANAHGVLGFTALSADDVEHAVYHLTRVITFLRASGTTEPGIVPFVGDALEALVAHGDLDEARDIVADDRLMGRASARPGLDAVPDRGTALLLAAEGDLDGARQVLEASLSTAALGERPFERARTLLVLGDVERRLKQRAQARDRLEEAERAFADLGASVWRERASAARARIGSTAAASELSPTEERLARLVADGLTNKEVAERMFLSVKTVEANLSRIYRKVGVRSRAELVRAMDGNPRVSEG